MEENMSTILSFIETLGLEAGKDRLVDKKNEYLLSERLNNYIMRQAGINELCTLAEEVDFQGLANYLSNELLDDVKRYLFGEYSERDSAKRMIYSKAFGYARTNGNIQEDKVKRIVDGALDILSSFYREQINSNDKFLAAEITGSITQEVKNSKNEIVKEIRMMAEEKRLNCGSEKEVANPITENSLFQNLHSFVMENYIKEKYRNANYLEQNMDTYSDMFKLFVDIYDNDKMVHIDKNIFDFVREDILTQEKGNLIKIVGPDGTGKSTFLSLLYIHLYEHCLNHGFTFYPFYINLHYYDQIISNDSPNEEIVKAKISADLANLREIVQIYPNLPYIVIIDGNENYFKTTLKTAKYFNKLVNEISGHKKIVCIGEKTNVHTYRERQNYTYRYTRMRYTFKFNTIKNSDTDKREQLISFFVAIEKNKNLSDVIKGYIKKFDLNEVDLNILNMFKACYERDVLEGMESVSDLYKNYCMIYLDDEDDFENSTRMSYEYFMTNKRFTQNEIFCNSREWNLIHQHKTISNFLIAYYYVEKLKNYSEEEDIAELEYLFPMEVNIFIKSLINERNDIQEEIFNKCKDIYENGGILAKSQALYMMGRITNRDMKQEIIRTLENYYEKLSTQIAQDKGAKMDKTERETHLMLRSLIISLVYLGEKDKREEYLKMLLNYPVANQINRGFHLEYYGDVSRKFNNRLYSYNDDGSEPMDATYEILLNRVKRYLSSTRGREDLNFQINLFTLCSLIQVRMGTKNLPENCIQTVKNIIECTLREEETNISIDLKAYLTMLYENIDNNTYASGCLYDKLYEVKNIIRKGWEQEIKNDIPVNSYENVAEHIYYTWMLGMIYLPDEPPKEAQYENYDKKKILDVILIHDWAEVDVGDVIPKENTETHKKLEDFRMRVLLMHDTYENIGNMLQYKRAWNTYGKLSADINGQIAYELDKIQALYQFYRYVDMGAEFTEEKILNWKSEKNNITSSIGKRILQEVVLRKYEKK